MSKWPGIELKSTELGRNLAEGRLQQLQGAICDAANSQEIDGYSALGGIS
jgi:hypothetical protein